MIILGRFRCGQICSQSPSGDKARLTPAPLPPPAPSPRERVSPLDPLQALACSLGNTTATPGRNIKVFEGRQVSSCRIITMHFFEMPPQRFPDSLTYFEDKFPYCGSITTRRFDTRHAWLPEDLFV
ncbi:hypothetical protein EVAR_51303_1 [Eumeta japonica]|uniref:Uncharacterized protein n=1 Tax=Eumeta variegata TaxID=151549 RepID=A0A4C1XU83_EUMVA|nr:hypothetical protein EVAR_51303_1 [Eumeta japonica]